MKTLSTRYSFVSSGKRPITKIVEFTPTRVRNIYNLGFGDLLPNGKIDDTANSNNGDIVKVLATVINILIDFTNEIPFIKIVFTGSTKQRITLYHRILRTYYKSFREFFVVTALINTEMGIKEVIFDPNFNGYLAFFVKKID